VTPGAYKTRGKGIGIRYGIHATLFGDCLIALTDKGICALRFIVAGHAVQEVAALKTEWPGAVFTRDPEKTGGMVRQLFHRAKNGETGPFHLHLRGTNFQLKVWLALLSVAPGALASYSGIAASIGCPKSARAVGTAIGKNPVGFLIPCHRVIHSLGTFGHYRWGIERKEAIIGWEAAQNSSSI
jgi:AraC family transcriptional regulator of adaptative response/methylated-DNA-[protein]-cysteine methyltransferase